MRDIVQAFTTTIGAQAKLLVKRKTVTNAVKHFLSFVLVAQGKREEQAIFQPAHIEYDGDPHPGQN